MNCIRKTVITFLIFLVSTPIVFAQIDTEFWFAAPDVSSHNNFDKPIILRVTSFREGSTITISQPSNGGLPTQTFTLDPSTSKSIDITAWIDAVECRPANAVLNKGIRISSTAAISVYYDVNNNGLNPELFVLKGRNALGNDFFISSQNAGPNSNAHNPAGYSSFNIVASENNTTVTITPSKNVIGHPAGVPYTIILNSGQSYAAVATSALPNQHLEGSRVTSNKPIAITLADDLITSPGYGCADLVGDQTIPVNITGTEYIATKGNLLGTLEKLFITATANNTAIFKDGVQVTTLNVGQTYTTTITNASTYIRSTNPVYVYQLSGIGCELGAAILPPIKCTGSLSTTFSKSTTGHIYLNLLVKNGGQNSFKVNNKDTIIKSDFFTPVPGTNSEWYTASVLLPNGIAGLDSAVTVSNSITFFHMGVLQGIERQGSSFGFFSSFNNNYANASTPTPTVCNGTTIKLFADSLLSAIYEWKGPNGFFSTQQNPTITNASVLNVGKYELKVTLPGCGSQIDSLFIQIGGNVRTNVSQTICEGGSYDGYTVSGIYIDTLTTLLGCDSIRTLNLTVKPRSYNSITQTICEGDSFLGYTISGIFRDTLVAANGCDSVRTLNLTVLPRGRSTLYQTICRGQSYLGYTQTGNYVDTLVAANGCDSIRTLLLQVDVPATPNLGSNRELCNGDTLILYPGNYASYLWQDNSTNSSYVVNRPGLYSVTVSNACGSKSEDVLITGVECVILFPNAFTPNGDNKNDFFKILNAFKIKNYTLSIFNRWGQQVFSTTDVLTGWDGKLKGLPQEMGTYVYYCRYTKDNKEMVVKGSMHLLR
jgi:gliding motility-associated-like protein